MYRRVLDGLSIAAGVAAALCLIAIGVLILLSIVMAVLLLHARAQTKGDRT